MMPAVPGIVSSTIAAIVPRSLEGDDLLEVLERALALLGLGGGVEGAAVEERARRSGPSRRTRGRWPSGAGRRSC